MCDKNTGVNLCPLLKYDLKPPERDIKLHEDDPKHFCDLFGLYDTYLHQYSFSQRFLQSFKELALSGHGEKGVSQ